MNLSSLKSRNFRLYLAGNLFAVNAFWISRVTVGWIAWDLTGSASFVGLISLAYFLPTLVAGPLFGVVTDRVNVRHAAMTTQSALLVLSLLLFAIHAAGILNEPQLAAFVAMAGLAMAAHSPIRMSLAPRLVRRDRVASVINIVAINFNLARLTGPAIGGWLIAQFSVGAALGAVALCYVPFLAALAFLRIREREDARARLLPFRAALIEGLRHVLANNVIRQALVLTVLGSFFIHGTLEILPVLADGVFDRGAAGLGMLTSASGFGALMGGLLLALAPAPSASSGPAGVQVLGAAGLVATGALGAVSSWPLALVLVAFMAACVTAISIICQSRIQMDIDDGIRGRAMSLWVVVVIGSAAAGAAVLGAMSDLFGIERTLPVIATGALVILGVLALRTRRA